MTCGAGGSAELDTTCPFVSFPRLCSDVHAGVAGAVALGATGVTATVVLLDGIAGAAAGDATGGTATEE